MESISISPMNTPLRHNVAGAPRLAIVIMYRYVSTHITTPTLFINVNHVLDGRVVYRAPRRVSVNVVPHPGTRAEGRGNGKWQVCSYLIPNHRLQSSLHVGAITTCNDVRIVQCSVPEENLGRGEDVSRLPKPRDVNKTHPQTIETPRRPAVVSLEVVIEPVWFKRKCKRRKVKKKWCRPQTQNVRAPPNSASEQRGRVRAHALRLHFNGIHRSSMKVSQ